MNSYTIVKNKFLDRDIEAYYRCDYLGHNQPGNPDYINDLKNTFNKDPLDKINNAKNLVKLGLVGELSQIISEIPDSEVAVCVVPRSKSLSYYSIKQLGFLYSIKEVITLLKVPNKEIIDGSDFIVRHTDTRTTHLDRSGYGGTGELPYVGITNDTCDISKGVRGKYILLIDDIYTKNVNVVEDAIQCLFHKGAKDVTFFSIARTPHYSFSDEIDGDIDISSLFFKI